MRLRLALPLMLLGVAAVTAFASCARANAADADEAAGLIDIATQRIAPDSVRVIASWKPACDAKGCADSYATRWTNGGAPARAVTVTGTADTARLSLPKVGDSTQVTVSITSQRRGKVGATRSVSLYIVNADAAPPPVDSLKADTGATSWADSVRTLIANPVTRTAYVGEPLVAERDSVLFVLKHYLRAGKVRPASDTTAWRFVAPPGGVATLRPFGARRDSAMFVVQTCGCAESGDIDNPPLLDLRTGRYVVKTATGRLRPVTRTAL